MSHREARPACRCRQPQPGRSSSQQPPAYRPSLPLLLPITRLPESARSPTLSLHDGVQMLFTRPRRGTRQFCWARARGRWGCQEARVRWLPRGRRCMPSAPGLLVAGDSRRRACRGPARRPAMASHAVECRSAGTEGAQQQAAKRPRAGSGLGRVSSQLPCHGRPA